MFMGTWALMRPTRVIFSPVSGWKALSYRYLLRQSSSSFRPNWSSEAPFLQKAVGQFVLVCGTFEPLRKRGPLGVASRADSEVLKLRRLGWWGSWGLSDGEKVGLRACGWDLNWRMDRGDGDVSVDVVGRL